MAATTVPAYTGISYGQPNDMLAALHDWQDDPDYGDGAGAENSQNGQSVGDSNDSSNGQSPQPPGESGQEQALAPESADLGSGSVATGGDESEPEPELTPEEQARFNAYLKRATHDQLKEFPAYNAKVLQGIHKTRPEIEATVRTELSKQAAQSRANTEWIAKLVEWDTQFAGYEKANTLGQVLKNPDARKAYDAVMSWREAGRPKATVRTEADIRYDQARGILTQIQQAIAEDDDLAPLLEELPQLQQEPNVGKFLMSVAKRASELHNGRMQTPAQKAQALSNEYRQQPQPTRTGVNGAGKGLTLEAAMRLPYEEYEKLGAATIDKLWAEANKE